MNRERVETVVIGGGQAGLAVGYHLQRRALPFVILDAHPRVGDAWRRRWTSLRLFTPVEFDTLPGMRFPAPRGYFPTKDEMADYLESYAQRFALPVRTGVRVASVTKGDIGFLVHAGPIQYEARNVVIAMSSWQEPRTPSFATQLDPSIRQLHSVEYREPSQLRAGEVLVVGAGNSGAEIALEAARTHRTWLAGRHTGHLPFEIDGFAARLFLRRLILGVLFRHVLTTRTPLGRKALRESGARGMEWIRLRPHHMQSAGIERVPRVTGVRDGWPLLEDGRALDVANVVWSTGFEPSFSWIRLPVFQNGEPVHERGVVTAEPGLYFVGLRGIYAAASAMVQGAGRDAGYVVKHIAARRGGSHKAAAPLEPAPHRPSLTAIERALILGLGIGLPMG